MKLRITCVRLFLFLLDIFLINVAFVSAFLLRYGINIPDYNFASYKDNFIFITLIYMLCLLYAKVYKKRFITFWEFFTKVFKGIFLGTLFSIALVYVFREKWMSFPSSVFVFSFPLGVMLVFGGNGLILTMTGRIKKKVVVIGHESVIKNSFRVEKKHVEKIEDLLKYDDIDEIVISEHIHGDKQLNLLIYLLLKLKVNVLFSPAIYAKLLSENLTEGSPIEYLATFTGRKSDYEEFLIRVFDMGFSIIMIIILSPLILSVALIIKLTSSGSILYKQERIAKDGKIFMLYKFKTMIDNAEIDTGPVLAAKDDPRVTKIGKILRPTRIDELPQLLNVILGDMSLVGPRPERPHFVRRHKVLRQIRLAVKPGLTGLAQIRNLYDLPPRHKIKYDYLYIQKRSLLLNIYILLKTIPVLFMKQGW